MSYDDEKHPTQKDAPPAGVRQISWPVIQTQKELSGTAETHRNGSHVYALQGKKSGKY